ncbi:MAG: hypothetical protein ACREQ5_23965 [Candidatus Dormibacteria bacterium]
MPDPVVRIGLGTERNAEAPWQSYDREMDPSRHWSPRMKAAVEEYSKHRHEKSSSAGLEEVMRQNELSTQSVKEYRFFRQAEDQLTDEKQRRGELMFCLNFVEKLNEILPAYLSSKVILGLSGLYVMTPDVKGGHWHYCCGVQASMMNEYSIIHVDSHGLPLNEKKRGWRTVLLRLITNSFISEEDAHRVFGEPTSGPISRRYREQLYWFRNRSKTADIDSYNAWEYNKS